MLFKFTERRYSVELHQKRRLSRYKTHLPALADKKVSQKRKRRCTKFLPSFRFEDFQGIIFVMKRMVMIPEQASKASYWTTITKVQDQIIKVHLPTLSLLTKEVYQFHQHRFFPS